MIIVWALFNSRVGLAFVVNLWSKLLLNVFVLPLSSHGHTSFSMLFRVLSLGQKSFGGSDSLREHQHV